MKLRFPDIDVSDDHKDANIATIAAGSGVTITSSKKNSDGTVTLTLSTIGGIIPAGGTTGQVLTKASNADGVVDWENAVGSGGTSTETFGQPGTLSTGVGAAQFCFPFAANILGVVAAVGTAPTGASIKCDVNLNGTTIFTTQANRPTIAAGAFKTTTIPVPDVTTVAQFDLLTVDIDQVGSTIPGADLIVVISYNTDA